MTDEPSEYRGMFQFVDKTWTDLGGSRTLTAEDLHEAFSRIRHAPLVPDCIVMHPADYEAYERLSRVIHIFGGGLGPARRIDFDMWVAPRLTMALRRIKRYRRHPWQSISMALRSWRWRLRRASHRLRPGR